VTKIILNDLSTISGNEQTAINLINANNETIETASDNTLSRDGTAPNQMLASLDMNSFRILNTVDAINLLEPPTYRQVLGLINAATGFDPLNTVLLVNMFGNGSVLPTGTSSQIDEPIPFSCQITGWTLLADQVGSIVIDIWKDNYGNFPPTVADTITAGNKPTLSSAIKNTDSTLGGWTKTISAGDTLRFNIDSVSSITRAVLALSLRKTS